MYRTPAASTAIPAGDFNVAAAPSPAAVEINPSGVILRTRLLPASATYRFPAESNDSPDGALSDAISAGPPSPKKRASPSPATVERIPPLNLRMRLLSVSAI